MTIASAKRFLWAAFAAAIFLLVAPARAEFVPPPFTNSVVDQTGKLTEGEIAYLTGRIEAHRRATGFVVAVFVPSSIEGESIEDVAYKTARAWKLGDEQKDNGVLLVIAPGQRRIETGKGAGGALTDIQSKAILSQRVAPLMKDGRLRDAINAGVDGIYAELAKDPSASHVQKKGKRTGAPGTSFGMTGLLFLLIPFGIFFLVMRAVSRMRGRRHDHRRDDDDDHRGGGGGFIAPIIIPGAGWGGGGGGGGGGGDGGDGGSSDWGGGDGGDYGGGGDFGGGGASDSD